MKENKWWKEIKRKGHFCPNLVIFYAFEGWVTFANMNVILTHLTK